jgi:hypothetical protein
MDDTDQRTENAATEWPVDLRGVTESVVTTLGPNERYNVAALGIHAPGSDDGVADDSPQPTARTWGRTRTWRNFSERGAGYVQFTRDPVLFANAALTVREQDEPLVPSADAWVHVSVERIDAGSEGETQWVDWRLTAQDSAVERRVVPTFSRGYAAVVEATVAASRLDVPSYDTETLRERIAYFDEVVERCAGPREREAFECVRECLEERQ